MALTVIKMHFPKRKPFIITHRKYENFRNDTFLTFLQYEAEKKKVLLHENG